MSWQLSPEGSHSMPLPLSLEPAGFANWLAESCLHFSFMLFDGDDA